MMGNSTCILSSFKNNFYSYSFRKTIRVSNSLDPDQARHIVGPELGPNCLKMLPADDTSQTELMDDYRVMNTLWIIHRQNTTQTLSKHMRHYNHFLIG